MTIVDNEMARQFGVIMVDRCSGLSKIGLRLDYASGKPRTTRAFAFCGLILGSTSLVSASLHSGHFEIIQTHSELIRIGCAAAGIAAFTVAAVYLMHLGNNDIKLAWLPIAAAVLGLAGATAAGIPPRQNRIRCQSCLRQIGLAMAAYAAQSAGVPPAGLNSLSLPISHDANSFVCPNTGTRRMIVQSRPALPLRDSASLFFEVDAGGKKTNIVYGDLHIEHVNEELTK